MTEILRFKSSCVEDTRLVGEKIAEHIDFPSCIYLDGDMGQGKTTLSKSIINGLGYRGDVTSPTYNLIQEYPVSSGVVFHMDLYRLGDPSELEFLALEDLWSPSSLFLIEWPQNGEGFLQLPSHRISIVTNQPSGERVIEYCQA